MTQGLDQIEFEEPWRRCPSGLEVELERELSAEHVLFGIKAMSVARRTDNDDVLFELMNFGKQFAVVHLTWHGKSDQDSRFPFTRLYDSFEAWVDDCMRSDSTQYEMATDD